MKKVLSLLLAFIMLTGALPAAFGAQESSLCFTWAWSAQRLDTDGSATVVSWTGGSYGSYRSAFVVFDLPDDFLFDEEKTQITVDFFINSATLNNGTAQAPTAAVLLVNGDSVKQGYAAGGAAGTSILSAAVSSASSIGTYAIDSAPDENALTDVDITDYFIDNPNVGSIGIYLTNLTSDGFDCVEGIASAMSDFSLTINTFVSGGAYIELIDQDGNYLDTISADGSLGESVNVSDFVGESYYKDGVKYSLVSISQSTITLTLANPITVTAVYEQCDEEGLLYPAVRSGYSGSVNSELDNLFVATSGGDASGTSSRAPALFGMSYIGSSANMGSARAGALEFEINSSIDPSTIADAELNFYVTGVHDNLYSCWIRMGVYETENPYLEEYSLGGMDSSDFEAVDADYSSDAVYWSNEFISSSSIGWKTVSLRKIIAHALDANNKLAEPEDTVRIVLRLQVPAAGIYIAQTGESNAPYLKITTIDDALVLCYDFESLTDGGYVEDVSSSGFDGTLLDDAKIENGTLVLNGNGGVKVDHQLFRSLLTNYTIIANVAITGESVTNTRIYDFGADAYNSGFLRVKEFGVGMKYNGGTTTIVSQNTGSKTPFESSGEFYQIAVTYSELTATTNVYVDGDLVISTDEIYCNLNDFSSVEPSNYIGRTNWHYVSGQEAANPDIKAVYEDFTVYSAALDERVICAIYNPDLEESVAAAAESINEKIYPYTLYAIEENLPLNSTYETGDGDIYTVTWHTSDSSVVDTQGNIFKGSTNLSAQIYAEVSCGEYYVTTDVFTITVKAISSSDLASSAILRYDFDGVGLEIEDYVGSNTAYATDEDVQRYARANLGENAVIKLPDNINNNVIDYTVGAWIRVDDISNDGQRIYDFGVENGTVSGNYYAFTKVNSDGSLTVGVNNGGTTQTMTSLGTIEEGVWTHVAVSYNSSNDETCIYINGELDTSGTDITYTMAGASYNGSSTSNYIGRSQWYKTQSSSNPDFKGKIDCFEFYSAALSASVIKDLSEQSYDTLDVEITSAMYVDGFNKAVVNISSNDYSGDGVLVALYAPDGVISGLGISDVAIFPGAVSASVELQNLDDDVDAQSIKCFLWESLDSALPLSPAVTIDKSYSFGYDYEYPDNHLLHNSFSLKLYNTDTYLSLDNGVSLAQWEDENDNLLWTAPYDYSWNNDGYYPLQSTDGTYLSLDTGIVKTGSINNWRFIQIDPELTDGAENVYALFQRSSGKYLAADGSSLIGASDYSSEAAWWVLDIREYDELAEVFCSTGFLSLTANQRERLYGVSSQAMWQSSNRRSALLGYIGSDYFNLSAAEQASRLTKIFSYTPSTQINRSVTSSTTGVSTPYTLSEISGGANYTGKDGEDLWAYTGTVTYYDDSDKTQEQQTVTIYGRSETAIENIAEGFSYIPYQFRKYIKTIKDYYSTANEFNCGSSEMYVRTSYVVSASGFAMTAAHEVGHSLSSSWGGVDNSTRYVNAISNDINYVSGYGSTNNSEDIAEFTQFVISCCGDAELLRELKVMFPNRFNVLRTVLREMNDGSCILDAVD